jgi:hypothetical protein
MSMSQISLAQAWQYVAIIQDMKINRSTRQDALKQINTIDFTRLQDRERTRYLEVLAAINGYQDELKSGACGNCAKLCDRAITLVAEGAKSSATTCFDWILGLGNAAKIGVSTSYTLLKDNLILPATKKVSKFAEEKIGTENGLLIGGAGAVTYVWGIPVGLTVTGVYLAGKWLINKKREMDHTNPAHQAALDAERYQRSIQESIVRGEEQDRYSDSKRN